MHTLPVADIWIQFAEDKEYVQQHLLGVGLSKVNIVGHTSFDILEDFGAKGFVGAEGIPGRLSSLSDGQMGAEAGEEGHALYTYFLVIAQRVQHEIHLIRMLDCVKEVVAKGEVSIAGVGKGACP